jgi:hypothetical protein
VSFSKDSKIVKGPSIICVNAILEELLPNISPARQLYTIPLMPKHKNMAKLIPHLFTLLNLLAATKRKLQNHKIYSLLY